MKKKFLPLFLMGFALSLNGRVSDGIPTIVIEKEKPHRKITDPHFKQTPTGIEPEISDERKIWFKFKDESLAEVVTYVANALKMNVVLPQGADALTGKISLDYPEKVTPQSAYEKTLSLLKISGYSMVPQNDFYYVVKNANGFKSQPYPLYVNTDPADLPDSDQVIRYMYYFTNLQVPQQASGASPLQKLLLDTMTDVSIPGGLPIIFDSSINGMLLTYYSRSIKSVMEMVAELDTFGFTDTIEIIQLKHVDSGTIAGLFKNLMTPENSSGATAAPIVSPQSNPSPSHYFSQTTRVTSEPRSNSLIVMGKKDAVERFKEFTKKYLDVPIDEGDSIIHIYPLQYLNAATFAPILTTIVSSQGSSSSGSSFGGTTGQSSGTANPNPGKQFFNGVIINAEPVTQTSSVAAPSSPIGISGGGNSSATAPTAAQQGGNRLIIASTSEDWARLKKLITELDKPQTQVALEILIVDLTVIQDEVLGSQVRNKSNMLPPGVNAQTSTLSGGIELNGSSPNYGFDALMANLLQPFAFNSGANMASSMAGGSFVLSLQDPTNNWSTWVLQALKNYDNTRILSHPFAVVLNNQTALFTSQETRLLPGAAQNKKGTVFAPIVPVSASLAVGVTPLINGDDFINLGINIQINEFQAGSSNAQNTRQVVTNANVKDGQVLVLGGLTQTSVTTAEFGTPGLSKLPVIGWLFKSVQKSVLKTNLAVFICPRRLESTNGYCDFFTASKFLAAGEAVDPAVNFSKLRDPITRWFFDSSVVNDNEKMIGEFLERRVFTNQYDYEDLGTKTKTKVAEATVTTEQTTKLAETVITPVDKRTQLAEVITTPAQKTVKTVKLTEAPKITTTTSKNSSSTEQHELKNIFASLDEFSVKTALAA